jgi:hypothetical protein
MSPTKNEDQPSAAAQLADLPIGGGQVTEEETPSAEELVTARDEAFDLPLGAANQREAREAGHADNADGPVVAQFVDPLPADAGQGEIGAPALPEPPVEEPELPQREKR